jgi:hypothetical protein
VSVRLESTPPGAKVTTSDGGLLCTTPCERSLPRTEVAVPIAFALDGYATQTRDLRAVLPQTIAVTMTELPGGGAGAGAADGGAPPAARDGSAGRRRAAAASKRKSSARADVPREPVDPREPVSPPPAPTPPDPPAPAPDPDKKSDVPADLKDPFKTI